MNVFYVLALSVMLAHETLHVNKDSVLWMMLHKRNNAMNFRTCVDTISEAV